MAPARQQNNADQHERRKAAGGSIRAFADQKGVTRSIRNFKHRKETKQNIKASRLRDYRKVMKKEGFEATRGGSRKKEETPPDVRHKKKPKMNPLAKSLQKKEEHLQQREDDRLQREANARKSVKRQKQRHREAKLLSRRTQRGQPMMKHMINNLLTKIDDK